MYSRRQFWIFRPNTCSSGRPKRTDYRPINDADKWGNFTSSDSQHASLSFHLVARSAARPQSYCETNKVHHKFCRLLHRPRSLSRLSASMTDRQRSAEIPELRDTRCIFFFFFQYDPICRARTFCVKFMFLRFPFFFW